MCYLLRVPLQSAKQIPTSDLSMPLRLRRYTLFFSWNRINLEVFEVLRKPPQNRNMMYKQQKWPAVSLPYFITPWWWLYQRESWHIYPTK